jgi:hypothetical protein
MGMGYEPMRSVMKGHDKDRYGYPIDQSDKDKTERFIRLMDRAPSYYGLQYRGERRHSRERIQKFADAASTGMPIVFPAHSSASVSKDEAEQFMETNPVAGAESILLHFMGKTKAINPHRGEKELIIPKDSKYRVTKFEPHKFGQYKHYAEMEQME